MTHLPSRFRPRSRSPPPPKARRRSRSPSPYKAPRRSRSPSPYKARRLSRSPPPPKALGRSRSPSPSKARRRSRSPSPSRYRRRSRSPPEYKARRRSRSPPPSKARRRSRSPPYVSTNQRQAELQRAKRPSADAAVDGRDEGDMAGPSHRPSRSHSSCKHAETSSAGVEKRPGPAIRGGEQELHTEKMDGKNQNDYKAPSRNARRKKIRRLVLAEAKNQMREMTKDKLLAKIKKLQDCVLLLEKDGADVAQIMEFRSLLESTKKQYEENAEQLAQAGSTASRQALYSDRVEETHVETMGDLVGKVEGDEQNMDSGEAEGTTSLKGCKAVSQQNDLAEEANRLKSEIEAVRQDHDYQLAQAQSLMADVAKQKEVARIYGVELEDAMRRAAALEEEGLLQEETIRTLQIQLASANEKLTVCIIYHKRLKPKL